MRRAPLQAVPKVWPAMTSALSNLCKSLFCENLRYINQRLTSTKNFENKVLQTFLERPLRPFSYAWMLLDKHGLFVSQKDYYFEFLWNHVQHEMRY